MATSRNSDNNGALRELAVRARYGDRAALERILEHQELKRIIYKIANARVGQTNADDVHQEVLLSIAQKIHTWQGKAEITTWIDRITRNACVDFLRRAKPNRLLFTETTPDKSVEPDQFHRLSLQEMRAITHQMLQKMEEQCRQLLSPYLIEGVDKREVMAMANLSRATFHRKWKACYEGLLKKIQKIL